MQARFLSLLESPHRILLTAHENPDVDATGSVLALAHFLRLQGKEVRIVLEPGRPPFLSFLDPKGWIEAFDPAGAHCDLAGWPEAWILLDASEATRLGKMQEPFKASKALKLCLDHHMNALSPDFDFAWVDTEAAASCELVHRLVSDLPRPLPRPMATAIYAGLVDDTGNFRFSNASPAAHRAAADLIGEGVDPARIYQTLYHQGRPEKLRIFGRAFGSLRVLAEGRYAAMTLNASDLAACGASHEDLEGLVNKPLEMKGVEVSALLYPKTDGHFKASLRSRERVDVNAICRALGGGGHRLASGATLDGPLESAQTVLDAEVLARLLADFGTP